MTLTKKKMVREIGRRTRLTNREVKEVVETLIDVWTETLVAGERIEIQNFIVLEVKEVERNNTSYLNSNIPQTRGIFRLIVLRSSKRLRSLLRQHGQ